MNIKSLITSIIVVVILIMIAGSYIVYSLNNDEPDSSENSSVSETTEEDMTEKDKTTNQLEESGTVDENDTSLEVDLHTSPSENRDLNVEGKEDKKTLSQYSSEQIEYARVWLQHGPNQEIDELYVRHIPAGTPLNSNDDTSVSYPEDVIQLAGSRLVDGSVTYSGNGDGTINVYKVPLRWDGKYPAGEKFYTDIIENTKLVYVDPGDDEKIIELIKLLNVH